MCLSPPALCRFALLRFDEYAVRPADAASYRAAGPRRSARCVAARTSSGAMSRMQRWWTRRQTGLWQGRQGRSLDVSIVAASGLSGAQCQGLVGPKMPIEGVPSGRGDMEKAGIVGNRRGGGGERQDGVAQIVAGQVAGRRIADDLRGQRFFAGAAQHPDRKTLGKESAGQRGIGGARPAFRRSDRARAQARRRGGFAARPRFCARRRSRRAGTLSSGKGHSGGSSAAGGSASAAQRSIMRGSARLAGAQIVEQEKSAPRRQSRSARECRRNKARAPTSRSAA